MDLTRRQAWLLIGVVVTAFAGFVLADQLIERVSPWDYDDFARWTDDLGVWGPIAYIGIFAASMVFAPLPTGPAPIAAATAFGGVLAFVYTLLAGILGASLCFVIARRWGRPVMERFLPDKLVNEIDRLSRQMGLRVLFLVRLFPILGVDLISYAAGLTRLRFLPFVGVSVLASTPTLVLVSAVGAGVRDNRLMAAMGMGALFLFLLVPLLYFVVRRRRQGHSPPGRLAAAPTGGPINASAAEAGKRGGS